MAKLFVERAGQVEDEIALGSEALTVGRDAANDLVLLAKSVSRRHARIEPTERGYRIVDLESGNGLVQNGERVPSVDIDGAQPSVTVDLGEFTLRFEIDPARDAARGPTMSPARLVLIGGGERASYPVGNGDTVVGRSSSCTIQLSEPLVSSSHFKIVTQGSVFALVDTGSENGTYVNGVRVKEKELEQGSQIKVGPLTFYFAADGVDPEPGTVELIETVQTPKKSAAAAVPTPAASATPPSTPAPQASVDKAGPSGIAGLPRIALIGGGAFVVVLLLIAVILMRSPDDDAEREFQEVFQANLSAEERQRIEEYQELAAEYEERANFSLALEQYRKILVLDETHQHALAESARLEERLEEQSRENAARAREDRERMAQVATLTERSDSLLAENQFDDARAALDEALALSPDSEVLASKRVDSYVREGDYHRRRSTRRSREAYQKALELDPGNAAARRGIGRIDQSRRAAQEGQKRVDELTETGLAQLKQEQFRAAYQSFSEVLTLEPSNARAQEFRDQAQSLLEQQVRPIYEEGVRLYNADELPAAMERFQRVLAIHPDHADTRSFVARGIERVRGEAVDLYKRAYIYEGLGRFRDALELYKETLALLPDPNEEYHQKASERIADLNRKLQ